MWWFTGALIAGQCCSMLYQARWLPAWKRAFFLFLEPDGWLVWCAPQSGVAGSEAVIDFPSGCKVCCMFIAKFLHHCHVRKNWCPRTRLCSMYATCYQEPKCSLKGTSWRTPESFSLHFYFQECKSISPKNVVLWLFFPNLNWMLCLHLAVVQFMCQSHREESFYK